MFTAWAVPALTPRVSGESGWRCSCPEGAQLPGDPRRRVELGGAWRCGCSCHRQARLWRREHARSNGIPVVVFPSSKSAPEEISVPELLSTLRYSGPTVHFVDDHYDTGRILAQRVVPVLTNDTPELLASRVLREEHQIYVEAVAALCDDRIVWRQDGVPLIRRRTSPDEYT